MDSLSLRIDAGRRAVSRQVDYFHAQLGRVASQWKADRTRVTAADLAIAREIFSDLGQSFPGDDLFGEEMDPDQGCLTRRGEFSWVLDPIDGTNNFALGVPFCSIALALLRNGRPVYGFVYDAARRRLIEGGAGFALRDGDDLIPSGQAPLSEFVGLHSARDPRLKRAILPIQEASKIRALGSSALHLAYVANGLLAGMVDVNVKLWDIAAGIPLCEAVGIEVRILNAELFPLESFDLGMPPLLVCAGAPKARARLQSLLEQGLSAS